MDNQFQIFYLANSDTLVDTLVLVNTGENYENGRIKRIKRIKRMGTKGLLLRAISN